MVWEPLLSPTTKHLSIFFIISVWGLTRCRDSFRDPIHLVYLVGIGHAILNLEKGIEVQKQQAGKNKMQLHLRKQLHIVWHVRRETNSQFLGYLLAVLTQQALDFCESCCLINMLGRDAAFGASAQLSLHCYLFMLETVLWCKTVSGWAGDAGESHTWKHTWHAQLFLYYISCQVRQPVQLIFLLAVYFPPNVELIKTFWTNLEPDNENQHYFYCSHFVFKRNLWRKHSLWASSLWCF